MKQFLFFIFLFSTLYANSSLRVQMQELQKNSSHYKILDTRDFDTYEFGHIPNAINFPVSLTYRHASINGKLTDPFTMQKIIRNLGLNEKDHLVIYDDGSFFDAARLFWALEVYGFKDVKLLDGGYEQWKNNKLPTNTDIPKITKSHYITIIDNQRLATKFATQIAIHNPNQIIIDARPLKAYLGEVSAAKRYGHIPKAQNIPASHNINTTKDTKKLKNAHQLQSLYKSLPKSKKIIIYCAVGRISSTNYFALRELGYDVSNYDASWKEWGNDFRLPIVNPSKNR